MKERLTRQGVRDLNRLPAKKVGIVLPELPKKIDANCRHVYREQGLFLVICTQCGDLQDSFNF